MACTLVALCIDARDPRRLAEFWSGVLRFELVDDPRGGVMLEPNDDTGFAIRFVGSETPKVAANQMHFDLTSTSLEDQRATVERALRLGARHLDVGQGVDAAHVVLEDPEGNEFCVIEPSNRFLAECGFLGALASEGSQEVGYFWRDALGWPLVWDQDKETAIRAPHGGPKITWGGPPLTPKAGKYRLHFDLTPASGSDLRSEIDRLTAIGATRVDDGHDEVAGAVMEDPDGHEFCVVPTGEAGCFGERHGDALPTITR